MASSKGTRLVSTLTLIITLIAGHSCHPIDNFDEELYLKPLPSGHLYGFFQFSRTLQNPLINKEHCEFIHSLISHKLMNWINIRFIRSQTLSIIPSFFGRTDRGPQRLWAAFEFNPGIVANWQMGLPRSGFGPRSRIVGLVSRKQPQYRYDVEEPGQQFGRSVLRFLELYRYDQYGSAAPFLPSLRGHWGKQSKEQFLFEVRRFAQRKRLRRELDPLEKVVAPRLQRKIFVQFNLVCVNPRCDLFRLDSRSCWTLFTFLAQIISVWVSIFDPFVR